MDELALKIENVSKEYRLGAIGGATLKGDLQSWWAKVRHKDDPNLKIGQKAYDKNERFMALNDLSFDIQKGETVGIIGQNGAGKSTILKLICQVTAPTKGNIYINGRITSMLEVGTGFHSELTGRENVFLNGAILGMSKAEIQKKFDEIVEFSEVGQFIDTPVKRYSSGMKVKLAFSVASHLDSEIMIMDEVLAVGDVNFQNKCIEQMKKVASEEGRTILYVSHNMATVKSLCNRCIVLSHGEKAFEGNTSDAIAVYMGNEDIDRATYIDYANAPRNKKAKGIHIMASLRMLNVCSNIFEYGESIRFQLTWDSMKASDCLKMKMVIATMDCTPVGVAFAGELEHNIGMNYCEFTLSTVYFVPGKYSVNIVFYDEDCDGNCSYYDCLNIPSFRFVLMHSKESRHLKQWGTGFGYSVIPCISSLICK